MAVGSREEDDAFAVSLAASQLMMFFFLSFMMAINGIGAGVNIGRFVRAQFGFSPDVVDAAATALYQSWVYGGASDKNYEPVEARFGVSPLDSEAERWRPKSQLFDHSSRRREHFASSLLGGNGGHGHQFGSTNTASLEDGDPSEFLFRDVIPESSQLLHQPKRWPFSDYPLWSDDVAATVEAFRSEYPKTWGRLTEHLARSLGDGYDVWKVLVPDGYDATAQVVQPSSPGAGTTYVVWG